MEILLDKRLQGMVNDYVPQGEILDDVEMEFVTPQRYHYTIFRHICIKFSKKALDFHHKACYNTSV